MCLQEAPSYIYILLICSLFFISILNTIVPVFVIHYPVYVFHKFLGLESSKDWSFNILLLWPVGLWCNQNFDDLFHFTLLTCFFPVLLIVIFPWKEGKCTVLIISVHCWWSSCVNVSSGPIIFIAWIRFLLDKIAFNPCFCCPANLPGNMLAVCQYPRCVDLYYIFIIWCYFLFLLKYWHYVDHSTFIIYDIYLF